MYAICVCFSLCFHGGFRRFYATRLSAGKFWMFLPRPTWIQWGFFVGQIQKCLSFCLSINLQVGYDFVIFCICINTLCIYIHTYTYTRILYCDRHMWKIHRHMSKKAQLAQPIKPRQ